MASPEAPPKVDPPATTPPAAPAATPAPAPVAPPAAAGAASSSDAKPAPVPTVLTKREKSVVEEYRGRITNIYKEKQPTKVDEIEKFLEKYAGQEHILYLKICRKYEVPAQPEYKMHSPFGGGLKMLGSNGMPSGSSTPAAGSNSTEAKDSGDSTSSAAPAVPTATAAPAASSTNEAPSRIPSLFGGDPLPKNIFGGAGAPFNGAGSTKSSLSATVSAPAALSSTASVPTALNSTCVTASSIASLVQSNPSVLAGRPPEPPPGTPGHEIFRKRSRSPRKPEPPKPAPTGSEVWVLTEHTTLPFYARKHKDQPDFSTLAVCGTKEKAHSIALSEMHLRRSCIGDATYLIDKWLTEKEITPRETLSCGIEAKNVDPTKPVVHSYFYLTKQFVRDL